MKTVFLDDAVDFILILVGMLVGFGVSISFVYLINTFLMIFLFNQLYFSPNSFNNYCIYPYSRQFLFPMYTLYIPLQMAMSVEFQSAVVALSAWILDIIDFMVIPPFVGLGDNILVP